MLYETEDLERELSGFPIVSFKSGDVQTLCQQDSIEVVLGTNPHLDIGEVYDCMFFALVKSDFINLHDL